MRIARFGALLGMLVVVAGGLVGCQGTSYTQPSAGALAQLPPDLPEKGPLPDVTANQPRIPVSSTAPRLSALETNA